MENLKSDVNVKFPPYPEEYGDIFGSEGKKTLYEFK